MPPADSWVHETVIKFPVRGDFVCHVELDSKTEIDGNITASDGQVVAQSKIESHLFVDFCIEDNRRSIQKMYNISSSENTSACYRLRVILVRNTTLPLPSPSPFERWMSWKLLWQGRRQRGPFVGEKNNSRQESTAAQEMTQLPQEPEPLSSLIGGRSSSSLQTTQLPLEPPLWSSSIGGRMISSALVGMVMVVKVSIEIGEDESSG